VFLTVVTLEMAGFVVHNIKLNFVDFGSLWHVITHTSGKILSLSYHTKFSIRHLF